jgi:hypothetical protein
MQVTPRIAISVNCPYHAMPLGYSAYCIVQIITCSNTLEDKFMDKYLFTLGPQMQQNIIQHFPEKSVIVRKVQYSRYSTWYSDSDLQSALLHHALCHCDIPEHTTSKQ